MSQIASARSAHRVPARRVGDAGRRLRVVTPPTSGGSSRFFFLCALLLLGGTIGVLVLNTTMAKGAYTMRDLQRRSDELADSQDEVRQSVQAVSGPGPLARRAREMGMVPADSAAFLRLSDGAVLGVPQPATSDGAFRVVTESAPPRRQRPTGQPPSPAPSTRPERPTSPATESAP
ncbi:MAG: hypothetical protein ACRCXL_07210 [Dermatophilaceae bacterium]